MSTNNRRSLSRASWPQPKRRQRLLQGEQGVKQQQLQQLDALLYQRRSGLLSSVQQPPSSRDVSFDDNGDDDRSVAVSRHSLRTTSTFRTNASLLSHRSRIEKHRNPQTLGVSVHWLKYGFLEEVKQAGLNERSTIYDIENLRSAKGGVIRKKGQHVVCPIDNQLGSAYVHALGKSKDKVGCANFMLSYVWGYSIGDIVDALWDHCSLQELDPKRTYVWICCLCVNQHRVASNIKSGKEIPFRTFRQLFYSRATAIGHILAMMAPWDKPIYIQRVWCIFEFFTASTNGHNVTVIMPPKEKREMAMLIATKGDHAFLHHLYRALQNTKVEEAEASYESDKTRIIQLVERNTKVSDFNSKVNELLRRCVLDSVLRFAVTLDKVDTLALTKKQDFLTNVGRIILARGEYEDSLEKYSAAIANMEFHGHRNDQECMASCHDNIGLMLLKKNDLIGAHQQFKKALSIRIGDRSSSGRNPIGRARSKVHFGHLFFHQGKYEDARIRLEKALSIIAPTHGRNHPETAQIYDTLGLVRCKQGDPRGSLWYLHKALDIRKACLGVNHPATATSRNNIGMALFEMGKYGEAKEYHEKALSSRTSLLGPDHPDTAASQNDLADVLFHSRMDLDEAMRLYRNAHAIRKESLGTMHPDTEASFQSMCKVADYHHKEGEGFFRWARQAPAQQEACADLDRALDKWQKAFAIRSSVLGQNHPDTQISHNNLCEVAEYFSNAGEMCLADQDFDGAIVHHQKALKVRKALLGRDHPASAMSRHSLCRVAEFCFDNGFCKYIESSPKGRSNATTMTSSEGKWCFNGGSSLRGGARPFCQACWTPIHHSEPNFSYEPSTLPTTWFYHCTAECLGAFESSYHRVVEAAEEPVLREDAELGIILQDLLGLNMPTHESPTPALGPNDEESFVRPINYSKADDSDAQSSSKIEIPQSFSRRRGALLRPSTKDTPRRTRSHRRSLRSTATMQERLRLINVGVDHHGDTMKELPCY